MSFSPLSKLGIIQNQNYIINSDFNNFPFASNATLGWSLKNGGTPDATTKLPTSAPSAAAAGTLTLTAVSGGSQISGTVSASLSSTAATTAGDMLITDALTLDLKAQSTIQSFSFSYKVSANGTGTPNFSGTSSNAIGVAIYDATNSAWIQPAGVFNLVQSSGVGRSTGTFQVPSNCTSVRLAVYFPNSTAASAGSPFTVIFDDFVLGPQTSPAGAAISDWVSYTPAIQGFISAPTVNFARYRRVGSNIEVQIQITLTSASNNFIRITGPTGFTVDINNTGAVGSALYYVGDTETYSGTVVDDSTQSFLIGDSDGSSWWNGLLSSPRAGTAAGHIITATFSYPVVGLSSNTVMSNDTDTRVVAALYNGTPTGTLSGSNNDVTFPTKISDTHSFVSGSSVTIPVSGFYSISASALISGTYSVGNYALLAIAVDTVEKYRNVQVAGGSVTALYPAVVVNSIYLNAGQVVKIQSNTNATSPSFGSSTANQFSISRLSGPATIAASETVAMSAYKISGNHTANGSEQAVSAWTDLVYDTHGSFNMTTGIYTVPVSGRYLITGRVRFNSSAPTITSSVNNSLGGDVSVGGYGAPFAVILKFNAGQTIQIFSFQNGAASLPYAIDSRYSTALNIVRVGN